MRGRFQTRPCSFRLAGDAIIPQRLAQGDSNPIIGTGSVPFRGHLTPVNIDRALREYPSGHTFTVQLAFKYDYDQETVRTGIAQLRAHERGEPMPIDQERACTVMDRYTAEYQSRCAN